MYTAAAKSLRTTLLHLLLAYMACVGGFWLLSRPLAGKILLHTRDLEAANSRLEREQTRSRELASQLIRLLEDTRREISRDIHDHIGQLLTTLRLSVENLRDEYASTLPASSEGFDEVAATVQSIQRAVKDIATGLRPPCLHYAGLVPTLEGLVEEFHGSGQNIHFFQNDVPARLPEEVAIAVYRLAQEALTNAVRHAKAQNIHMTLTCANGSITLSVEDDGTGFNVQDESLAAQNDTGGHLGLILMRERVNLLHGELLIESAPQKGTHIIVALPLKETL